MVTRPGETDRIAFEAAILPHLDAAYNLARWLMRNVEDAEDVVQEAMLRALTYYSGFKGENPRGWLLQIVRNAAYASMKLNQGARSVPITVYADGDEVPLHPELSDPGDDPEATLLKSRGRQGLDRLLAELPVDLRETIVLRELEEMSYKEISQITGAPMGTVMSRLWRARKLLTEAAKAAGGDS
jgi:RNA polymerase sigma-70 factor (ECF subfamily)